MNIIFYVFAISSVQAFESTCRNLHISTDILVTKDDVVKGGVTSETWTALTTTPQIVDSSLLFDFLYITLEGKQFTDKMFQLEYDDHFFANSTIHLEHDQQNVHSLKIEYRCKQYGGALINYDLAFSIPDCGTAHIHWKKICGNPLVKRQWLSMDVAYKQYNQSIVKNGELVNQSYFDRDVDNLVFTVPPNVNFSVFYLYMDLPQGFKSDQKDQSKEFFEALDKETADEDPQGDEFQILETILKMIPEVEINKPIVDADHSYLKPQLSGDLANGGVITDEPSSLIFEYNCISSGETIIELNIPLEYFRDITMVFVKQCLVEGSSGSAFMVRFFYLMCLSVLALLGYTIWTKKLSIGQVKTVLYKQIGGKQSKEEDYESEFKINRLDQENGRYGSI